MDDLVIVDDEYREPSPEELEAMTAWWAKRKESDAQADD